MGPIALSYLSRGINLIALYNWPLTEHVYWIALKINITIEGSGENNFPKLAPFIYRVDLLETPFFEYMYVYIEDCVDDSAADDDDYGQCVAALHYNPIRINYQGEPVYPSGPFNSLIHSLWGTILWLPF